MGRMVWSFALVAALLVPGTGIVHADNPPDLDTSPGTVALLGDAITDEARDVSANWLLGVQAGTARTFPRDARVDNAETFRLVLREVAPVTMFSDRPIRESRFISPRALASNWSTWFAEDPPNALITVPRSGGAPESFVVTLDRPMWIEGKSRLVFQATRERVKHDPQVSGSKYERPQTPRRASGVSVFIDGVSWWAPELQRPQKGPPPPRDSGLRPPLSLPTLKPVTPPSR